MKNDQHTLFISDLHLDPSAPKITGLFEHFLSEYGTKAETLYILGDLFEAWFGDDHYTDFTQHIKQLIKNLTEHGTSVYFMRGNRDFLLGKRFAKQTGSVQIFDPTVIDLYGQPVILTHGDILCTHDKLHQFYRGIIQHPWILGPGQYLPLFIRQFIGKQLRSNSQTHIRSTDPTRMDVHPTAVNNLFKKFDTNVMIHGHTHRPAMHKLKLDDTDAERIVLASWHDKGQALKWHKDGTKSFIVI